MEAPSGESVPASTDAMLTAASIGSSADVVKKGDPSGDALDIPHDELASLADADRKKMEALRKKKADLEAKIESLRREKEGLSKDLIEKDATTTVKNHIQLLHKYNEMKDIGMGLLGMIAEQRGTPVKEVMQEFGLDKKD